MSIDTSEHLEVTSSSVENAISLTDSMKTLDMRESRVSYLIYFCMFQLRWFYRDSQDKKWVAFNGYDSLRLEAKYRTWRSTHPKIPLTSFWPGSTEHSNMESSIFEESRESPTSDLMSVSVLGGLYEADICHGVCAPIYWTGWLLLVILKASCQFSIMHMLEQELLLFNVVQLIPVWLQNVLGS